MNIFRFFRNPGNEFGQWSTSFKEMDFKTTLIKVGGWSFSWALSMAAGSAMSSIDHGYDPITKAPLLPVIGEPPSSNITVSLDPDPGIKELIPEKSKWYWNALKGGGAIIAARIQFVSVGWVLDRATDVFSRPGQRFNPFNVPRGRSHALSVGSAASSAHNNHNLFHQSRIISKAWNLVRMFVTYN